jgi:type IV fimbrial biogenesis protein FimT
MVELMVALAVVAILSAMAVPAMRTAIENSHIRAAASSMQNGLAMARAEAVRMNTQVRFTVLPTGWSVRRVDDNTLLNRGSGKERAASVVLTISNAETNVVFDPLGRRVGSTFTQIDITSANPPSAGYKPMRIQLVAGGTARLCDPAVAATEPKACL